jgi:hypothetical protein
MPGTVEIFNRAPAVTTSRREAWFYRIRPAACPLGVHTVSVAAKHAGPAWAVHGFGGPLAIFMRHASPPARLLIVNHGTAALSRQTVEWSISWHFDRIRAAWVGAHHPGKGGARCPTQSRIGHHHPGRCDHCRAYEATISAEEKTMRADLSE